MAVDIYPGERLVVVGEPMVRRAAGHGWEFAVHHEVEGPMFGPFEPYRSTRHGIGWRAWRWWAVRAGRRQHRKLTKALALQDRTPGEWEPVDDETSTHELRRAKLTRLEWDGGDGEETP